jgi:hypothetical protein
MFRSVALLIVVGFCLGAGMGCSLRTAPAAESPARPFLFKTAKTGFAVEGQKRGQWQVIGTFSDSQDAQKRAEQVRLSRTYAQVRIRQVRFDSSGNVIPATYK